MVSRGIVFEDVASALEIEVLKKKLKETISDDQISEYYAKKPLNFERVEVYWIYISDEDLAKELMLQVNEEMEDFRDLARLYSEDEETCIRGGFLGCLRRRDLPEYIADHLFVAPEGQAIGPLKVNVGFATYFIKRRYKEGLEDVREKIKEKVFDDLIQERVRTSNIRQFFNMINRD